MSLPIELGDIAPPVVIEKLDYEAILQALLSDFRRLYPDWNAVLESEPVVKLLELTAYRELLLRQRVNDAARAVMLAYATGSDLEHLAANFNVSRLGGELDAGLRRRVAMAFEGLSTAGPVGAYVFHSLSADARVLDATVKSPSPGEVLVTVLSREGNGAASPSLLSVIESVLTHDNIRPLTDRVTVRSAAIVPFAIEATLFVKRGPESSLVKQAAAAALDAVIAASRAIGTVIARSALFAALHQPGVQRVELRSPVADIEMTDTQAAWCTGYAISTEVL